MSKRGLCFGGAIALLVMMIGLGQAMAQDGHPVEPQAVVGTAFTYQGQLTVDGSPAAGTFDLQFRLADAATGGSQVGSTQTINDLVITDGLLVVALDFGPVFDGTALWLQIGVREGSSTGAYQLLSPRQPLTVAPYAAYAPAAGGAPWSGLSGVPAGLADGDDDTLADLACPNGQIAKRSGGVWGCASDDDTTYTAGAGLNLSGTTFNLAPAYRLPQGCAWNQVARWDGCAWSCGEDENTTYSAGTGLALSGTVFRIDSTFQLPQVCPSGDIARWDGSGWVCDQDNDTTYSAGTGLDLSGTTLSLETSYALPQGCLTNRLARWDGSAWSCYQDQNTTYSAGDGLELSGTEFRGRGTAYDNVVIVAQSGGDYTSIQSALNSITDASSSNRYLVWVGPGKYSERVTMKSYVDIEGAGQGITVIAASGSGGHAGGYTVKGADNATIRELSILNSGGAAFAVGFLASTASARAERVSIDCSGGSSYSYGAYLEGVAFPELEDVVLSVTGGGTNSIGVYVTDFSFPTLRRVEAHASGSTIDYGLYVSHASSPYVEYSTLSGSDYGIYSGYTPSAITITLRFSQILGSTATIHAANNWTVKVGASYLSGGAVSGSGTVTCGGVFDEAYAFYSGPACP